MKTKFTSPFPRAAIMLLVMMLTTTTAWAQGAGTMDNPYQISNYAQLKQFASIVNGGNIDAYAVLTADIACTDNTWTPIGCDSEHSYAGTFDGRGYTITGLSNANNASSNNAGLFGNVASEGTVKNVILVDAAINGESFTGSIAGWNGGTVQNCCLIGASNISSIDKVGGIVGYNCDLGKIQNCYVATSGSISISTSDYTYSKFRVGGIAGLNNATIQNCHFSGSGSLSGSNLGTGNNYSVGGIVGETTYGSIVRYCYYAGTGTISGNTIGAIIGSNSQTVTSCYYNTNNTSLTKAIGNQDDTDDVKGLTAAQFKNISNFSGFTPENWFQGVVAPLLKGMPYTISFNANGGTGSMANQTVTSTNSDALSTNTFTRTGYHFTGWNTKADGTGVAVAINTEARQVGSETLYAQWEATSGTCGDYGNADNVTWAVTDTNDDGSYETLTISGTGAMKNYPGSNPQQPWAAFKDVITTANIGDGVTRIGGNAFYQFTALTSVTIASSVTTIGNAVFFECTNLTTVSGASGVTYVDSSAFDGTAWENNLPDGLTSVGHVAYRFVGDGTSVNLDAATTQIYEYCFQGSKITSIVIPASVERIGDSAFASSALQKMYVLRSGSNSTDVTSIGEYAFSECRDDLVIVVPTAAYSTYSGHWYSYNSKLQRGYTVTCGTGITFTTTYNGPLVEQDEEVTLSGTGTIPDGYAFAGYSVTKDGTNPAETVTVTEASGVYSFTMPAKNVTVTATFIQVSGTCGDYYHESEVTWEVTDTDGDGRYDKLTIGGTGAMKNYSSYNQPWAGFKPDINTLVIGDGVTIIGTNAFNGCTSLATVTFDGTPQLTAIYGDAFYGCAALTTINIPASVTTLYGGVFQNCTNLATVSGGDGLTSIGTSAFYNTPWKANLNDNIPNNALFYLGHVAFRMKGDASNITLDEGTTQIYDDAFYGNSTLTTIIIPASVTSIGECAFGSCENLSKVYVLRTTPITTLGGNAFDSRPNLVIVAAAEGDYSGDAVWHNYNPQSGYTVTCGTGITFTTTNNGPLVEQDEEVTLSGTGTAPAGYTTPFIGYSVIDRWGDPVNMLTENTFEMPGSVIVNATWTPIPWAGSGDTADDPYIIEYPSQLDLLATNVNNGESYSGKYFVLANDITYTHTTDWNANSEENNYTAIGGVFNSSIHPFNGTFDGKGHTVSGIRIYKWGETNAERYQGLFGYVGNNGTVKNVTVADACISGYEEVGGVVGQIEYGGKVENCHATATVALHAVMTKTSGFGGIAGITYNATISGCSSAVTLTSKTGCYYFGAIVGCANMGTLRNNLAIGTAIPALKYNTNYEASGAIVGHNGEATLEHNYYSGCTVGDATSGIGSGYHINGSNDRHDVTDNDGAVPAIILSETQTSMPTLTNGDKVVFRREFKENVASTVCLPFSIDADQAAAAGKFYTFVGVDKTDSNDWEVIMQEADPTADPPVAGNKASTLSANTPYLFKPAATGPVLFHGAAPASVSAGNTIKEDWTFQGTYENLTWDDGQTVLYGLAGNAFTPTGGGTYEIGSFQRFNSGTTAAFRAYMYYGDTAPAHHAAPILPESMKVRLIAADGSTTEVKEVREVREVLTPEGMSVARNKDNIWYTLDGRKLNAQPTQKGLYIVNGKKVVIK